MRRFRPICGRSSGPCKVEHTMKKDALFKWNSLSFFLSLILLSSMVTIIIIIFYLYHEGLWQEMLVYYKYFFEPARLRKFITSFGPYAPPIFVFLQCVQVFLAPIPGDVTGFVGGLLFGKAMGTVLSTLGLLAGSLFAFSLSRIFGMTLVERAVKKKYVDRFDHFIMHKGFHLTFILFLVPGFPKDSLCYLLGISHMRYRDFIIMNLFGRLPGTLLLTWQGDAVRNGKYQEFLVLLFATIVLMLALFFARNYIVRFLSNSVHLIIEKMRALK
jgi:uncharacterized membrane protein YdjX (TVP38/TMEM64 family)